VVLDQISSNVDKKTHALVNISRTIRYFVQFQDVCVSPSDISEQSNIASNKTLSYVVPKEKYFCNKNPARARKHAAIA